ncbi:YveK family protein [Erysipelothrix anatis]|uniref:YveK family protein n=1 Tax=Erysipelothrix anatis TaxID=2683713 RepID=UPI00135AC0C7|nr:Wzz/FepE/Etk N-terminal domain-containing protein [Erysipelothrix anatis]
MNEFEKQQTQDVEISELVNAVKPHSLLIIMVMAGAAILSLLYTKIAITPIYESSATMIVNNRQSEGNRGITNDDINSAKGLANVYGVIIKSDSVMAPVNDKLDLKMTTKALSEGVKVSSVDNTQVMRISVRHNNPETAQAIAGAIVEIAPNKIVEMVEAGSVKVISNPTTPSKPVSPNTMRNVMLASAGAAILTIAGIVIRHLMDKTFKRVDDLENALDLPVLGVIPDVSVSTRK